MSKILITGGAGCLGTNIVEKLFSQDIDFLIIDNYETGKKGVLPSNFSNIIVKEGDIKNRDFVRDTVLDFKPDIVIHSAAAYKDPENHTEDVGTNILGTINLVDACKEVNIQRIINFQTALCYGRPSEVPIKESQPNRPFTSYGISKTSGEDYLKLSQLPYISLRLANICAPRLAIGPIPTFYTRLQDKRPCFYTKTRRDFLDIDDFISLLKNIINFKEDINDTFNVSTGISTSIKEIYYWVKEFLEERKNITSFPESDEKQVPSDDVEEVVLNPQKVEKAFNWKAKLGPKETIFKQLEWYEEYGVTDIYSHLKMK